MPAMRRQGASRDRRRRGRAAARDRGRLRQLRHALLAGLGSAARPRRRRPRYRLPLAPTPHPLLELLGVILAPLGASATLAVVVALAYLALAALGYLVYRLGTRWFSWPVGLAAAALILTRYEVLQLRRARLRRPPLRRARARGAGARDAPAARRLAGARAARPRRPAAPRGVALRGRLLALPVARVERRASARASPRWSRSAPLLWMLSDLLVTGRPLWSLTHTQSTARQLHRTTGLLNVPYYGRAAPRRGARAGRPVAGGARRRARALADALARAARRRRGRRSRSSRSRSSPPRGCRSRTATSSCSRRSWRRSSAGAGLFGWRSLAADHPRRRLWQGASLLIVVAILAAIAWQVPRLHKTFDSTRPPDRALGAQQRIQDDLAALVASARHRRALRPGQRPLHHAASRCSRCWLHTSPANIVVGQIAAGTYLAPRARGLHAVPARSPRPAARRRCAPRLPAREQPLLARVLRTAVERRSDAPPAVDRAPAVEARRAVPPPPGLRSGNSPRACRHPLKAASFRT